MQSQQQKRTRFYSLIALCGLVLLFSWPTLVAALPPLTPAQGLAEAWRKATQNGVYHYQTDLVQTTHPTEKLVNVGRSPKKKVLHLSGEMDRPNETMHLSLSQANRAQPLELKVEKGVAYGWDAPSQQWVLADEDQRNLFTLGEDPLAFLNAATNIQQAQPVKRADLGLEGALLTEGETLTPYTFQIDGPQYAAYMRDQLEAELRRKGELPPGLSLGTAKVYKEMTGQGEVWLNEAGLPVRQTLHLKFSPEKDARNWYSADITTNYNQWGEQTSLGSQVFGLFEGARTNPAHLLKDGQALLHRDDLQTGVMALGFMALFVGLAALSVLYRRSPKLYNTFATAVIFTMLVTPLLQSQRVFAFNQGQTEREAEQTQKADHDEKMTALEAELTGKDFNPLQNPLAQTNDTLNALNNPDQTASPHPDQVTIKNETSAPSVVAATSSSVTVDCETDTDNDGLDDVSISDTNDADFDGLSDSAECYKTGTWTDIADSDGDNISDGTEVAGVTAAGDSSGTIWYLDPLNPDSNGDSLDDLIECPDLADTDTAGAMLTDGSGNVIGPTSTECADTDGDGVPDIFDFDNDGDGVPDSVDSSPNYTGNLTTQTQSQVYFSFSGYYSTTERVLLVDFELRPTVYEHLYQTYNVLDWPDNDTEGQVTRVFETTWEDEGYSDTKTDNGDLMLIPMLEIKIPAPESNPTNPAGGLPVLEGVEVYSITNDMDLSLWLDTDTLSEYSIEVSQDEDTGTLYAYLPLYQLQDEIGDTPVAWSGQMYYKPEAGFTWGENHQARMVWLVNALVDECDTTNIGHENYDIWCSTQDHWTTSTSIIQTYYEDFYLTGLNIKEDNGFDVAVIGQNDALSQSYEDELWYLSYVLAATFGEGILLNNGARFDIAEIERRFGDNSPYSSGDPQLWGLDNSNFTVESYEGYPDQITGLTAMLNTHLPNLLETTYTTATADDIVTILFAREETYRTTSLDDDNSVTATGSNDITLEVNLGGLTRQTYATLNWAPYQYDGADWDSYDYETYLNDEDDDPNQLGDHLESAISEAEIVAWFDDLGESYTDLAAAKGGIIGAAKNYYLAFYLSQSSVVEDSDWGYMNDEILVEADFNYSDYNPLLVISMASIGSLQYVALATGDTTLDEVYEILVVWDTIEDLWDSSDLDAETTAITEVKQMGTALESFIKWRGKKIYKARTGIRAEGLEIFTWYGKGIKWTHLSATTGVIAAGLAIATLVIGGTSSENLEYAALIGVVKSALFDVFDKGRDWLVYTARWGEAAFHTAKNLTAIEKLTRLSARMGFALDVAVASLVFILGLFSNNASIDSLAFTALLADFFAQVITAIVVAVISTTVVGALVIAVITLIDAVIALICKAVGVEEGSAVDTWVCGGIMGAFTEAVTELIYDQTPLVNLSKENRVDFSITGMALENEDDGFIVGNGLQISAVVTSALYFNAPDYLGWFYVEQFSEGNLKESAFAYKIQTAETGMSVAKGDTTWTDTFDNSTSTASIPSAKQFEADFDLTSDYAPFSTAGLNQAFDALYFSEAFEMNAQECWGAAIVAVCYLRDYADITHSDISEDFVFDIFPSSFSGLIALSEVKDNSYRLAWDSTFPTLRDADGDGLPSISAKGSDPDDGNPDTDGDGLSDYWEEENGSDPTSVDYDCDGLTDYWEAFYGTEPYQADTDGDGLPDGLEVYHPTQVYPYKNSPLTNDQNLNPCQNDNLAEWLGGWEIVYAYDNNDAPLNTTINADPLLIDGDGDDILDRYEYVYGYNPNVANDLTVLTLETEVTDVVVSPGDTIPFTATIKNELDNRYATGLLQAELPVDTVQVTEVMDTLAPQDVVTMINTVNVPATIATSQVNSLTVRAGALIEDLASDHILLLALNETVTSHTFADDSLLGNDAFCNGPICPVANGSYLNFDGVDDHLIIPDSTDFNLGTGEFTIALWFRKENGSRADLFNWKNDAGDDFGIIARSDETIDITLEVDNSGGSVLSNGTTFTLNTWHHLALVRDSEGNLTTYLDGVPDGSGSSQADLSAINPGTELWFGANRDAASQPEFPFEGDMNRIEIYNTALSEAQIQQLVTPLVLEIDLSQSSSGFTDDSTWNNPISSGGITPDVSSSKGAEFSQVNALDVSGDSLDLTDSDFTFAMWLQPAARPVPSNISSTDWQGVFGNDSLFGGLNYPSLYVSEEGHLRMRFGTASGSSCTFETEDAVVTYDEQQYVVITYDGNTLTFYINGEAIEATRVDADCPANSAPQSITTFSIGRPNTTTYLYFNTLVVDDARNANFQFNLKYDGAIIWSNNVSEGSYPLSLVQLINDQNNHTVTANVSSPNRGDLSSTTVSWENLTQGAALGFDSHTSSSDSDAGSVSWSVSNDYFVGYLDDFQLYRSALDAETIANLYNGKKALVLRFDEPPGQDTFSDDSGNDFEAVCDSTNGTCPDSGIPGRSNQALRFDGDQGEYVQVNVTDLDESLDDFTVGVWFKLTEASNNYRRIIHQTDGSATGRVWFGITNDDYLYTYLQGFDVILSSHQLNVGQWYYAALTFKHDDFFGDHEIILGLHDGSQFYTTTSIGDVEVTDGLLYLGADKNLAGNIYFTGLLDELTIRKKGYASESNLESAVESFMQEAPIFNLHLNEDLNVVTFQDDTPYQNDPTCNACPAGGDKGQIREAALFDGGDSLSQTVDGPEWDLGAFTVSAWAYPTVSKSTQQIIIEKYDSNDSDILNFKLALNASGFDNLKPRLSVKIDCESGIDDWETVTAASDLNLNQWNHIVGVYDKSDLIMYINGSESKRNQNVSQPCGDGTSELITVGENLEGKLDEIAVYGVALDDEEIADLYSYQSAWYDTTNQHLITVDTDDPVVTIGLSVTHMSATTDTILSITAYDISSSVTQVEYQVNGGPWLEAALDEAAWIFTFSPTREGVHIIDARATDAAGNVSTDRVTFTVDNSPPTLSLDSDVTSGAHTSQEGSMTLRGRISDSSSGIAHATVSVALYDEGDSPVSGYETATLSGDAWTVDYPLPNNDNGLYVVQVLASDDVGNSTGLTNLGTVALDTVGPVGDSTLLSAVLTATTVTGSVDDASYPLANRVLHFHFEEGANTTAFADSSGNFLNATCTTCPTAGQVGYTGLGLTLDGADDFVSIPHDNTLAFEADDDFSLALWVKASSTQAYTATETNTLLEKWAGSGGYPFSLSYLNQSGGVRATRSDGNTTVTLDSTQTINDGQFHHLALVKADDTLYLYIDGTLDQTATDSTTSTITNTDSLHLGASSLNTSYFTGNIDELLLYNTALTTETIASLGEPPEVATYDPVDLVVHYRFEESTLKNGILNQVGSDYTASCNDTSCPTVGQTGQTSSVGSAFSFEGDDALTIDESATPFDFDNNSLTVMAWINHNDSSDYNNIVSHKEGSGVATGWTLRLNNDNVAAFFVGNGSTRWDATSPVLAPNTWYHLSGVLNRTDGTIKLYVDGALVDTQTGFSGSVDASVTPLIGRWDESGNFDYFEGLMDEVMIFERALLDEEIEAIAKGASPAVSQAKIRYRHASGAVWPGLTPDDVVFYAPLDTTAFADLSLNNYGLTCATDCPVAEQSGQVGYSAEFNEDDLLLIDEGTTPFEFDDTSLTVMAWVNHHNDDGNWNYIFSHKDGAGTAVGWNLRLNPDNTVSFFTANGSIKKVVKTSEALPADTWYHLTGVLNRDDGTVKLYLDGDQVATKSGFSGALDSSLEPKIGSGFAGFIDEVVIFNRALSADEITLIANTDPWQPVTLDSPDSQFSTWSDTIPSALADGLYKLDLWTTDSLSNSRYIPDIWTGEIDTLAPTLVFTVTDLGGGLYDVTCEASDFNLSETGWACPFSDSPTATYLQTVSDYGWYTSLFSATNPLVGLSAGPAVISGSLLSDFTACDTYGHCNTAPVVTSTARTLEGVTPDLSLILNGLSPTVYTDLTDIPLKGALRSASGIQTLTLKANDQPIHTQTWSEGQREATWATVWTPSQEGVYYLKATLTTATGEMVSNSPNDLIYVDLTPPTIAIKTTHLNRTTYRGGTLNLTGTASDATALKTLQGRVDDGPWQPISLPEGDTYHATLVTGVKGNAVRQHTVTLRATDYAGHTTEVSQILAVDLLPPTPFNLIVTTDGQALSEHQTVDWLSNPLLTATWPDDEDVVSYYVEWLAQSGLGTTVLPGEVVVQSETITTGPTTSSYQASEGQIISLRVTATDGAGNTHQERFGPVYIDEALTPVLVSQGRPPYRGWLETSCNLIGLDNRQARQVTDGSIFDKPQQFYTSWNEHYLRLAWAGADWRQQGDLFIYLDTGAGGSTTAYNPFGDTVSILLPTDLNTNTQMGADYLIWVRETPITQSQIITDDDTGQPVLITETVHIGAMLLAWDDGTGAWLNISSDIDYRLDTNRLTPLTDLSLPFTALGISDPASQPLGLVALATEENALEVWATMPTANNLNSGRVIGSNGEDAVEAFTLLKAYHWATLGSGQCPSGTRLTATGQRRPLTDPVLFNGANLAATISADPGGVSYNLFEDNLIFAHNKLFGQATDWAAMDDTLCAEWEAETPPSSGNQPLPPPACRQTKTDAGDALNPHRTLGRLLNTDHPYVVDGQELKYTVRVVNTGDSPSYNVTLKAFGSGPLALPGGTLITDPAPSHYIYQQVIPVLEANQAVTVAIQGVVDFNLLPAESAKDWTRLSVRIFDETGSEFSPNEELHLDHQIDSSPPDYIEWQTPVMVVGGGETLVRGVVHDESAVPTIILDVAGQQTTCPDPTPADHQWACLITLPNLADGMTLAPRMKAIDEHGFETDWFLANPLTVDAIAPTLTVFTDTLADGLLGPFETTLQGDLSDNRYAHEVVVCDGADCESAIVNLDPTSLPQTTFIYNDAPANPIALGSANTCPNEFLRTIAVTDTFVIADLDVGLNLEHDNRNDVVIFLTSPTGTRVEIASHGGGEPNLNVRLDDAALRSIYADDDQSEHTVAPPYYQQERRPYSQGLARFRGEQAQGTWTFNICDSFPDEDEGWYHRNQLFFRAQTTYNGSNATWTYDLNLPPHVENLTKTLAIYGVDEAGNTSPTQTFAVVVDTQAPRLTLTDMAGFVTPLGLRAQTEALGMVLSNQPFTLTGSISDTNNTFMNLTILNENARYAKNRIDDQETAWVYKRTTTFNRPGLYKVWIEGNDRLGNTTTLGPYHIQAIAAPRLVKSLQTSATITVGSVVTYTITLYNDNGDVDFVGVVITDPLTSTLQPIAEGAMVIDGANNTVSWPAFDLPAGAQATLTFQAVITTTTLGTETLIIPNRAYVTVSGLPQVSSNEVTFDLGQLPSPSGDNDGRIYLPLLMKSQ